jgi:methylenetetrahydrofolate dehydrogenase (NADP+)/methenyltetrahydrofolate cyclohydrolase
MEADTLARDILSNVATRCLSLKDQGTVPGLALILVSDAPYARRMMSLKADRAKAIGFNVFAYGLDGKTDQATVIKLIQRLNHTPNIHGIFVQTPLPFDLSETSIFAEINPEKDVDGYTPFNQGKLAMGMPGFVPCAPLGGITLLKHFRGSLSGLNALIIGRSTTLGKPLVHLLLRESCTVTIAHSLTSNLGAAMSEADIIVTATGKPGFIKGSLIKPGSAVLDMGATLVSDVIVRQEPKGDVDFESAITVASHLNRPTGAIGPMTIALLLHQTTLAAEQSVR